LKKFPRGLSFSCKGPTYCICLKKLPSSSFLGLSKTSEENSQELFALLKAKKREKEESDRNILDLMTGVLKAIHSSSKADLKIAKEKERRQKILQVG